MILDVEHMFQTNEIQYRKWNILLSDSFIASEGPTFKYELMFSEDHNRDVII